MRMTPHGGGELVDLRCTDTERPALLERAHGLRRLTLDARELTDLELLAVGGLSPLRGFLTEAECKTVVDDMHLPGGVPWTLPVTATTLIESRSRFHFARRSIALSGSSTAM